MCLEWMVFDLKFNVLFDMLSSLASHKGGRRKHLRSPPLYSCCVLRLRRGYGSGQANATNG